MSYHVYHLGIPHFVNILIFKVSIFVFLVYLEFDTFIEFVEYHGEDDHNFFCIYLIFSDSMKLDFGIILLELVVFQLSLFSIFILV